MKNVSEDLAYMAGILDGEGSIYITKARRKRGNRLKYDASIKIAMNDKHALEVFRDYFGGQINIGHKKIDISSGKEYVPAYVITYGSKYMVTTVLGSVLPFLRVKSEQAKLVLSFLDFKDFMSAEKKDFRYYGKLNNLYLKCRGLKKKNWIKLAPPSKKAIAN